MEVMCQLHLHSIALGPMCSPQYLVFLSVQPTGWLWCSFDCTGRARYSLLQNKMGDQTQTKHLRYDRPTWYGTDKCQAGPTKVKHQRDQHKRGGLVMNMTVFCYFCRCCQRSPRSIFAFVDTSDDVQKAVSGNPAATYWRRLMARFS